MEVGELLGPQIRCPSCLIGILQRETLHKWKCNTCGYWSVNPPLDAAQMRQFRRQGRQPPLTSEQKEALKGGREQWETLTKVTDRAVLVFIGIFALIAFSLNLALRAAIEGSLSVTGAVAAWVATGFLGLLAVILFGISSTKRRILFGVILAFFIATGQFWYELALAAIAL